MLIDLTQTLHSGIPDWEGCCGFQLTETLCKPSGICVQTLSMPSGIGTHMDAPRHFAQNGQAIADLPLECLIAKAVVIDCRPNAHAEYFLTCEEILIFEKTHGEIPEHALVLLLTGWSQYWHDSVRYRNPDASGHLRFPGFSEDSIDYLLTKSIVGIGIDTLSPDGSHPDFPVHRKILGSGKYILENLCHLEKLPPMGAKVMAFPLKIRNGSEAPCRVIAEMSAARTL